MSFYCIILFREIMGKEQKNLLITYIRMHTFFARKQVTHLGPNGNQKYNEMWRKLASKLNEIGPAVKSESQWLKVSTVNIKTDIIILLRFLYKN